MRKYREQFRSRLNTPDPSSALEPPGNPESWHTIHSQYGLDDMEFIGIKQETSVDQEYMLYITSPIASATIDLVSFWEVCTVFQFYAVLLMASWQHRWPGANFLHFSGSQWITYPSKHRLCLVNGLSPRQLKLLHLVAIASSHR